MTSPPVVFVDLAAQRSRIAGELTAAMNSVMDTSSFIRGPALAEFETAFGKAVEARCAYGVASGTDALNIAAIALRLKPGDEVITVPNSWISTALAATHVGARPVFVDIDPLTYQMDPEKLDAALSPRTRAVFPVHLFGHPAPMDRIMKICQARGIPVVEDVAQAPLARVGGRQVGTIGDIGCYSFYPSKNLGCMGDGGAIVTNNPELGEHIRMLTSYGMDGPYSHRIFGFNSRLDTLQAAILRVKLRHLESWTAERRHAAARYTRMLSDLPVKTPVTAANADPVWHLYVIETDRRDQALAYLRERGVLAQIHYPVPIHLQRCYSELGYRSGSCPVAERAAGRILSLPFYPEITEDIQARVVETLRAFLRT